PAGFKSCGLTLPKLAPPESKVQPVPGLMRHRQREAYGAAKELKLRPADIRFNVIPGRDARDGRPDVSPASQLLNPMVEMRFGRASIGKRKAHRRDTFQ